MARFALEDSARSAWSPLRWRMSKKDFKSTMARKCTQTATTRHEVTSLSKILLFMQESEGGSHGSPHRGLFFRHDSTRRPFYTEPMETSPTIGMQSTPTAHAKSGPRDVFVHLLAIIGLYTAVGSFITIVFGLINIYIPDPALYWRYGSDTGAAVRFPIAVFIVAFPVYALLMRTLNKDVEQNAAKRDLRVRKWLFYLTISLAAVLVAGDLIATIYQFLEGNLTLRFGLQVITLLAVASIVGFYYYHLIKGAASPIPKWMMKWFHVKVGVIVLLALAFGLYNAGTPEAQRLRNLDSVREENLQQIQSQVVGYWQAKQKLPESLDALRDVLSGYDIPVDPETKSSYGYRILGDKKFELCATFALASVDGNVPMKESPAMYGDAFISEHPAGDYCFTRTIDPELYAPVKR